MSIFSYNFPERSCNFYTDIYPDNSSKKAYDWDQIKKQMTRSDTEKPKETKEQIKPESSVISRESSWSFFNNPRSEWEDRRKNLAEEYKKEMQAKFQEKIQKDQKPKYLEKREFYTSFNQPNNPVEDPKPYNNYHKNAINTSVEAASPIPEKFEYYSPQIKNKYNSPNPRYSLQEKNPEPHYEYSKANLTSDQNKLIRERQLQEWKKTVQAQMEDRNKIKEEQKSKKLLEDKLEEAKIKRELDELNRKYQKEIRYETGFNEEKYEIPSRPPPKIEERETPPPSWPVVKHQVAKPKEDYKIKHDLVFQEAGIRDVIIKIRSEASHAAAERQEILAELERMKSELRLNRQYDPYSSSKAYKPVVNRYIPFTSAGKSIITNTWKQNDELHSQTKYFTKNNYREYNEIDSSQVKNQLNKLDELLMPAINENILDEDEKYNKTTEKIPENLDSQDIPIKILEKEEVNDIFKTEVIESTPPLDEIIDSNNTVQD